MLKSRLTVFYLALLSLGSACMTTPPAPSTPGDMARAPVGDVWTHEDGRTRLKAYRSGSGPEIVMFASAGREASDFNELATNLTAAAIASPCLKPRPSMERRHQPKRRPCSTWPTMPRSTWKHAMRQSSCLAMPSAIVSPARLPPVIRTRCAASSFWRQAG